MKKETFDDFDGNYAPPEPGDLEGLEEDEADEKPANQLHKSSAL